MAVRSDSSFDDVDIDLGVILRALWRAKFGLLLFTLFVAGATAIGLSMVPPRYKSEAKVVIEARDLPLDVRQRGAETERAVYDEAGIGSQVQLLTSRDLARRVVAATKLADEPEFNSAGGMLSRLLGSRRGAAEDRVLDAYFERLNVYQVEKSRVITIEFSSRDPALSARVANMIVTEFLKAQGEAKLQTNSDATRWLQSEIDDLRRKVGEAEEKVEKFRSGTDLYAGQNRTPLTEQQLGDIGSQLSAARSLKTDLDVKVRQLKRLIDSNAALDGASDVLNAPTIQRLRERQSALRSRIAELGTVYLPGHPQIQALQAQIGDVEAQMRIEARKVLSGLETDLRVAEGRIRELTAQAGEYKAQSVKAGENEIQLRALEREAKAQRDLLETFLARYREAVAKQRAEAAPADARVISEATVPVQPAFPKLVPLTSVAAAAAFLLGATFVTLRSILSGEAMVRRPIVAGEPPAVAGGVPVDGRMRRPRGATVSRLMPKDDDEPLDAEGVASVSRIWSELAKLDSPSGRVLVASATSRKAADIAAIALSRVAAKSGARVCLLDLNGREPDDEAGAEGPGLPDLLAGRVSFAQVIYRDRRSRAHIVPAGPVGEDLVSHPRLATVIEALEATYDFVVLDLGLVDEAHADLAETARAIVVAADGAGNDPRTHRCYEALSASGGENVFVLSVESSEAKSLVEIAA